MHCGGCVSRITKSLSGFADKVQVTLEPAQSVCVACIPMRRWR